MNQIDKIYIGDTITKNSMNKGEKHMDSYEMLGGLIAMLGGLVFVFFILAIALYVLMGLSLMTMAKNKGIENPWLAFVPVGNMWIIGKIIETIELGEKKFENAALILTVGCFVSIVPIIGSLLALVYMVVVYISLFKLYKMYAPENATLYLILTIFVGVAMPFIFYFKLKDVTPVAA